MPTTHPSTSFNCITLTLLLIPTIIILLYIFTSFPNTPESVVVTPGLGSLVGQPRLGAGDEGGGGREGGEVSERVKDIYGEDFWERRVAEMDDVGVRVEGGYVQLPLGRTRYWVINGSGEARAQIVLIHGLSVPSIIWTDVAPYLAQKGYQVLVYDLYSRGYTSSPHTPHTTTLYTTQLALLLLHLGPPWTSGSLNLVGISMGGGIAAAFAVQFPHLVSGKVGLVASAGVVESADISRTSRFLSSPLIQLVTSSYPFRLYLKHLARTGNESVDRGDRISELIRIQSAHLQGYNPALASSIRDGPVRNLAPVYAQLGRLVRKARRSRSSPPPCRQEASESTSSHRQSPEQQPTPEQHQQPKSQQPTPTPEQPWRPWHPTSRILLIWGTKDRVVPFRYAEKVLTLVGGDVGWVERYGVGGFLVGEESGEGSIESSPLSEVESSPLSECSAPSNEQVFDDKDKQHPTADDRRLRGGGEEKQGKDGLGDGRGRQGWESRHAKLVTIEGAGHDLTGSHPELVVKLLDEFFAD